VRILGDKDTGTVRWARLAVCVMIPRTSAEIAWAAAIGFGCAAIAVVSDHIAIPSTVPAAAWWPIGVALGGMIAFGRAVWPGVAVGWLFGALLAGMDLPAAAATSASGTLAALGGAWLARRVRLAPGLDHFRDVGWLILAIIPATGFAAGAADAAIFAATGLAAPGVSLAEATLGRALGGCFSGMAFVPLMMGIGMRLPIARRPLRWLEFLAIIGAKAITAILVNSPLPASLQLAMVVSQFPLLAWVAVRFNLLGTGILIAFSLVFAMYGTVQGAGPLSDFNAAGQWTTLTSFCILSAFTALLLYNAMEAMRRMQREVVDSERRLRDIADSASDFFWETDARGRLLYVSERFAEFVGSQTELLLGRQGFRDQLGEAAEADWPELLACMQAHAPYRNLRIPVTVMDGQRRILQVSGTPVFDERGAFRGYRGACSDVTAQIEAADALFQARKMESVGQLTGGLAHDFNNLLAVIIGNMELAEETLDRNDQGRALLRKALNAAERGALLIQRLLAFSRRQALSPKVVDVNLLIAGLSDILEHSLGDTIHIARDLERDPWLVRVDPSQLESVILNLALNARDAMPSGGRLTITARNRTMTAETAIGKDTLAPGDYMAIEVADTGQGMTAEVLGRIFEPFFTTKDTGRGSGLGLSMAYGFVRQSGGVIGAESEVGRGSRITFYLPRHRDAAGGAENAARPPDRHGRGEKLMLVEDDAAVRDLLVRRLRGMGYDVVAVDDAVKALDLLPGQPDIDLLLTDIVLPGGMYGDRLAIEARTLRPGLKVLFMSGYPKDALDHLGRMGVDAPVLRKPFRNQELAEQLGRLLDRAPENA